jgi:MYXO-CTERM domain-containing protein
MQLRMQTMIAGSLVVGLGMAVGQARADFSYTNFGSESNVTWQGLANPIDGAARLTTGSSNTGAGALWHNSAVNVRDAFETTFTLRLSNSGGSVDNLGQPGGDGMAFVIQGMGTNAVGGAGGFLGYAGITNSLAVEFDTWYNSSFGDTSSNTVSIMSRGALANSARFAEAGIVQRDLPGDMIDNTERTYRVVYEQGQLMLFIQGEINPLISTEINLEQSLGLSGGFAYIGFTGGTFAANADQDVLNWSYTSVPTPGVMGMVGVAGLVAFRRRRQA